LDKLVEVKEMSKEEKKASVKAVGRIDLAAKSVIPVSDKYIHAHHVPAVHVFSSINVLMDNLRRNYVKNIYYPWDVSFEPVIVVPKATLAISAIRTRKFPSTF
jgi:hypothetical protein